MGRPVRHHQIYRSTAFGGALNTTLCGRMSGCLAEGMNVAVGNEDVTCKFCLAILARKQRQGASHDR